MNTQDTPNLPDWCTQVIWWIDAMVRLPKNVEVIMTTLTDLATALQKLDAIVPTIIAGIETLESELGGDMPPAAQAALDNLTADLNKAVALLGQTPQVPRTSA